MKPHEILAVLDNWRLKRPEELLASPAWAMPCRLGEEQLTMRSGAVRPADALLLRVRFGDTPHTLAIAQSERFPELTRVWHARNEMPEAIILALVERECTAFLQLLENAMRKQLSIDGLGGSCGDDDFCGEVAGITFTLTRSAQLVDAFGRLGNLEAAHAAIRDEFCTAECEYASFAFNSQELDALAHGDAVVVPELDTPSNRMIIEEKIVIEADGVSVPYASDTLCHIRSASPLQMRLGDVFDGALQVPAATSVPLKLVLADKTVATGHLERLASQPVFIVETE